MAADAAKHPTKQWATTGSSRWAAPAAPPNLLRRRDGNGMAGSRDAAVGALGRCHVLSGPRAIHRYAYCGGNARGDQLGSSYSGTILLPERRRSQLLRDLPDGPQVCRSTRTSRPISLAKEVPPRRERDLILLPHVLSYPGTPRQAWNEVQPIATPGAGTSSRVSRLAEPTSQA